MLAMLLLPDIPANWSLFPYLLSIPFTKRASYCLVTCGIALDLTLRK
jgi:hypothetical protein